MTHKGREITMLESCQNAQERWGGVHLLIDRWLQERRGTLQERMHKKRRRDLEGAASGLRKVLTVLGL